jgi:hypothetical protein
LNAVVVSKPSLGSFMLALSLGGMCVAAALVMQNNKVHAPRTIAGPRTLIELIGKPVVVQPSAFDEESSMRPSQLLGRWDGIISEASKRFNVPKGWIRAVMARESGGRTMLGENQPIISRAGAVGLMQVLPETYVEMAQEHRLGNNPFDAHDNILAGAAYLRWLHHKYGYPAMFAAYNAGPGRLEDHLAHGVNLPAETRAYVGGITKTLKLETGKSGLDLIRLTRPDGTVVKIDPAQVIAVRAALPGEYADNVKSVITLGKHKLQAICEDVQVATIALRTAGKVI